MFPKIPVRKNDDHGVLATISLKPAFTASFATNRVSVSKLTTKFQKSCFVNSFGKVDLKFQRRLRVPVCIEFYFQS